MFVVINVDPLQYRPSMTLKNRDAFLASCCSSRSKPTSSIKRISGEVYRLSFLGSVLSARLAMRSASMSAAVVYLHR